MTEKFLKEIRSVENLKNAIIGSVVLESNKKLVTVRLITDVAYSPSDKEQAQKIAIRYVPQYFNCAVEISKLSPDCDMVKEKIIEALKADFKALSVTVGADDITVTKCDGGFVYTVSVLSALDSGDFICDKITQYLKKCYCGEFVGKCVKSAKKALDIEVEEEHENIEFEIPIRRFHIANFSFLEGTEKQDTAVYLSDINFESEKVVVCGRIEDIRERTYKNAKGVEKVYLNFTLSDSTATMRVTYFTRQKSIDKIRALKIGDSIVCTGKTELYNGDIRFTVNVIDYGTTPEGFVHEKRASKPVPKYYTTVKPQPYTDISQTDMFTDTSVPDCLKGKTFVVFDLETTGLNSAPTSGNMDKIIEIGAFKIKDGVIAESFTTFINPQKKLSEEIINLTGITEEMVANAPTSDEVMPDFFKFCDGSILVGHNIAGFDFKFVEYYCARIGYMPERKLIDTIPLSQELLFLSNYKLNTVADKFGITFNHHRAIDDALVTAKIFIELIKIKKSLPNLQ
ncbi:MAG: ribonuclease H-like domain-containing protein [Clostridia bacterium]|nr:ribonuclease H-like domain-containing protein [Clostridia bacterium]